MKDEEQIEQVLLDNWGYKIGRLPHAVLSKMVGLVKEYGHNEVVMAIQKSAEYEQSKWNYAYVKGICEKTRKEKMQSEARSKQLQPVKEDSPTVQRGEGFRRATRELEEILGISFDKEYKQPEKATDKLRKQLGKL